MTQEEGAANVTFSQSKVEEQPSKIKTDKREKLSTPTKVIIRRLPPSMTQESFLEQIAPVPDHDYMYFVKADMSLGQYAFSRAYINFINQQEIYIFKDKFDDYVFVDNKGNEYPAVVEFAPFQKVPKKKAKKDSKCGTIEQDPDYIKFVENWNNPEEVSLPSAEFYLEEIETREREMRATSGDLLSTTPLIEYLKQRRAEKQRIRDEKREERRRRDLEKKRLKEEDRRRRKIERDKEREKMKEKEKSGKESDGDKSTGTFKASKDTSVKLLKNPEREKEKTKENDNAESKENVDVRQKVRVSSGDSKYSRSGSYHENDSDRRYQYDSKLRNKDKFKDRKEKERDRFSRKATENVGPSSSKSSSEFKKYSDDVSKKTSSEHSQSVPRKSGNRVGKSYERSRESLTKSRESRVTFDCTEDRAVEDAPNTNLKSTSTKESNKTDDVDESQKPASQSESKIKEGTTNKESEEQFKKKSSRSTKELKTDRRIRNKDRPSMEIYRPGMRRLSLQRNSPQKESPTSSSSPSPTSELGVKCKGENSDDGKNTVYSNESSPTEEQQPSTTNQEPPETEIFNEDAEPSKNEIISSEMEIAD